MARRLTADQLEEKLAGMEIERPTAYMLRCEARRKGFYKDPDGRFDIRHFRVGDSFVLNVLISDEDWKDLSSL